MWRKFYAYYPIYIFRIIFFHENKIHISRPLQRHLKSEFAKSHLRLHPRHTRLVRMAHEIVKIAMMPASALFHGETRQKSGPAQRREWNPRLMPTYPSLFAAPRRYFSRYFICPILLKHIPISIEKTLSIVSRILSPLYPLPAWNECFNVALRNEFHSRFSSKPSSVDVARWDRSGFEPICVARHKTTDSSTTKILEWQYSPQTIVRKERLTR